MLKPGIVSVSHRDMSPDEVIALALRAGLHGIEWGGDIHVPHGDAPRAAEVGSRTLEAGLEVAAYGTYYRVGHSETAEGPRFAQVLESAEALGAPIIRVWAGAKPSKDYTNDEYAAAVDDSRRIADLAGAQGIRVAFEFHGKTLTDSNEAALRLLDDIDHPNIFSFWQPPVAASIDYCLEGINALVAAEKLASVHVFYWAGQEGRERFLLEEGRERWLAYLNAIKKAHGDRFLCLEFSRDNDPENTVRDAATLQRWLNA